jgi:hypothetical protein
MCNVHGMWFDPGELRPFIERTVRATHPLPNDPSVDLAIASARREAQRREGWEPVRIDVLVELIRWLLP